MATSPWLWLNEAADLIAKRLTETGSGLFSGSKGALIEAREQLIDQAYRGALKVEGKQGDPEVLEPHISRRDWDVVESSVWDPKHVRSKGKSSLINLAIIWENNCLSYEEEGVCFGYAHLRIRASEVDCIWPTQFPNESEVAKKSVSSPNKISPRLNNKGGRPPTYLDDLLAAIDTIAKSPDGLPRRKGELFRQLRKLDWPNSMSGGPTDGTVRYAIRSFRQKLGS